VQIRARFDFKGMFVVGAAGAKVEFRKLFMIFIIKEG